jgi:hypothetical protein
MRGRYQGVQNGVEEILLLTRRDLVDFSDGDCMEGGYRQFLTQQTGSDTAIQAHVGYS